LVALKTQNPKLKTQNPKLESKGTTHETLLSLSLRAGGFAQFWPEAPSVLLASLAAKRPQIQIFRGEAVGLATTLRCDWSPRYFHATIRQRNELPRNLRGEAVIEMVVDGQIANPLKV
jgi:hypothetical protein